MLSDLGYANSSVEIEPKFDLISKMIELCLLLHLKLMKIHEYLRSNLITAFRPISLISLFFRGELGIGIFAQFREFLTRSLESFYLQRWLMEKEEQGFKVIPCLIWVNKEKRPESKGTRLNKRIPLILIPTLLFTLTWRFDPLQSRHVLKKNSKKFEIWNLYNTPRVWY